MLSARDVLCAIREHMSGNAASDAELGARLDMEPGAVRVAITRLRHLYRERLLQEIATSDQRVTCTRRNRAGASAMFTVSRISTVLMPGAGLSPPT